MERIEQDKEPRLIPPAHTARYNKHRFPGASIRHGVWLSSRCTPRSRDGPERLCDRGSPVSHAAIRTWGRQVGHDDAQRRRRRPPPGANWAQAEGVLPMHGACHDRWRAVDHAATGLDSLGQRRRHKQAAKPCCRTLLNGRLYVPRVISTEQLKSYGATKRASFPGVAHRPSRPLPKRRENAPRPPRPRERRRQGLQAAAHTQRCLSASGPLPQHVRPRQQLLSTCPTTGKRCDHDSRVGPR
jgi:putative transposase